MESVWQGYFQSYTAGGATPLCGIGSENRMFSFPAQGTALHAACLMMCTREQKERQVKESERDGVFVLSRTARNP